MNVTVTDVLGSLFNPTDTVCFRVFDDKKGGVFQGSKLSCECGKYKSIEETLKNHNAMNRGIFFVVNYGGQDDDSITRINAQFVEMDNDSFDEQQKKIDAFPLPPSMIMKTQKSYHVYWFMDGSAKVERFRMIQTQLVKHFDGDPMCVNESRVMRLPGFMHCKKDTPVEVTCVSFHPERKYTQDQLSDVLPEADLVPVERKSGTEKGIDRVMRSCVFMQHCRDDAASLSEHDWYDTDIFTEPTMKGRLGYNAIEAHKHLYDYILYDSTNERDFAAELDTSKEVAVYVKLPRGFFISTPVGKYNPDWAIAFHEGMVKHIYFVAETKGAMSSMQLRLIEEAKIKCAREHFKVISTETVKYDVVDSYESLMAKVMQ